MVAIVIVGLVIGLIAYAATEYAQTVGSSPLRTPMTHGHRLLRIPSGQWAVRLRAEGRDQSADVQIVKRGHVDLGNRRAEHRSAETQ